MEAVPGRRPLRRRHGGRPRDGQHRAGQPGAVPCVHCAPARSRWPGRGGRRLSPPVGRIERDRTLARALRRGSRPLSLRCQPQVIGECLTQIRNAADVLITRPTPFPIIRWCLPTKTPSTRAAIFTPNPSPSPPITWPWRLPRSAPFSERRIALMIDTHLSKLPPFFVEDGGPEFGLHGRPGNRRGAGQRKQGLAHPA